MGMLQASLGLAWPRRWEPGMGAEQMAAAQAEYPPPARGLWYKKKLGHKNLSPEHLHSGHGGLQPLRGWWALQRRCGAPWPSSLN